VWVTVCTARGVFHLGARDEQFTCRVAQPDHVPLAFEDADQAAAFVRGLMREEAVAESLRRLALPFSDAVVGQPLADDAVIRALAHLIATRRLAIVECRPSPAPVLPEVEVAPPAAARKKEVPALQKHWIEFLVVDVRTGQLVPEVSLCLDLPGRGEEEHSTEAAPLHINLSRPGVARIVEMRHLDVWEVVDVQSG